jgi:CRP-like cAMP-binding protein
MSMSEMSCNPLGNELLWALAPDDRERLAVSLQTVSFSLGEVICEPGTRQFWAYFPVDCIVSLLYTMRNGATAETVLVGNDGVVGTSIFLSGDGSSNHAVVTVAGKALALPAQILRQEFLRRPSLQCTFLRYTQALLAQISQTAVCNRLHSMEQRLCRWLLLCHDRTQRREVLMTQEFLASMLGGRRESVTVAAGHLQDAGLIHYCRGRIQILDRRRLESNACECYGVVTREFRRLLGRKGRFQFSQTSVALREAG